MLEPRCGGRLLFLLSFCGVSRSNFLPCFCGLFYVDSRRVMKEAPTYKRLLPGKSLFRSYCLS